MPQKHATPSTIDKDQFIELAAATMRQLPRDIDSKTAQFLIRDQDGLRNFLAGLAPKMEIDHPHEWSIWLGQCPIERLVSGGGYNWVNQTILEKFWLDEPAPNPEGLRRMCLLHFNCSMTEENVVREMARYGYRPATHVELIALQAMEKFTITRSAVALGSKYRSSGGGFFAVCVEEIFSQDSAENGIRLDLRPFKQHWTPHTRFAAVKV